MNAALAKGNSTNGKVLISTGNYTIHTDNLVSIDITVPEID